MSDIGRDRRTTRRRSDPHAPTMQTLADGRRASVTPDSDRYQAYSAGSEPTEVHPCAIEVMAEEGSTLPHSAQSHSTSTLDASFDYVVTMCAAVQRDGPIFPWEPFSLQDRVYRSRRCDHSLDAGPKVHRAHPSGACATESETDRGHIS